MIRRGSRPPGLVLRRPGQAGELVVQPFELGAPDVLAVLSKRDDGRHGARARSRAPNSRFPRSRWLGTDLAGARARFSHRRLQIVDVVEEDLCRRPITSRAAMSMTKGRRTRPHDRFDACLSGSARSHHCRDDDVAAAQRGIHPRPMARYRAADGSAVGLRAMVRLTMVTWCTPCDFMCRAVSCPSRRHR